MVGARPRWFASASIVVLAAASPMPPSADTPLTFPSMDVTIVYTVAGSAEPETLWVSPGLHLQRVDAPGGTLSVVTDRQAGRMTVIDRLRRTVTVLPAPPRTFDPLAVRGAASGLGRAGSETIAGLGCLDWRLAQPPGDPAGGPTIACLDAQGDTLRLASGDLTLIAATSVSHAALAASTFASPPGYAAASPQPAP